MAEHSSTDLGGGLVLRQGTAADTEALVAFYAEVFRRQGDPGPNTFFGEFVRDLAATPQAPYGPGNFTVVEDTNTGAIVSSLNLISQTWSYGGIDFPVGRIEPVGTLPDYRHRGLVRRQFELAHRWSAERGELVQAITGIAYFYRQFGYEYTIEMMGARRGSVLDVPPLKEGEAEPYPVRPAAESDLSFIKRLSDAAAARYLVTCRRDEAQWRHELSGRNWMSQNCYRLRIIETPDGRPVGYLGHATRLWGSRIVAQAVEIVPGLSWYAVLPSVLRYLRAAGQELVGKTPGAGQLAFVSLSLGEEHPAYAALSPSFIGPPNQYPYLVRVPDLPAFVRHVAPVLEQRLAQSSFAGHSGEFRLCFWRSGLRLLFEQGRLVTAEPWMPTPEDGGNVGLPDLTFLKLLFGYRTLEEIRYIYPDVWADELGHILMPVLFPRQPSNVWAIG